MMVILSILLLGSMNLVDKHLVPTDGAQLIHDCGGGSDNNGILWSISGEYYAYPGEDISKLSIKYSKWWPSVNSETMVVKGGGVFIPDKKVLAPGAMKEYERLMRISKIKYVKYGKQTMVTREFL